jgi:hypothetical protein
MAEPDDFQPSAERLRVSDILMKVVAYQRSLADGRAVDLEELQRKGVLSAEDIEFLSINSVTYTPHRVAEYYHALDMFQMPTADGGCVAIGPNPPTPTKRTARFSAFKTMLERFLSRPKPADALLLHVEFTETDTMGVAPGAIFFTFGSAAWRVRLPAIRSVATGLGLTSAQDELVEGTHTLIYAIGQDTARTVEAAVTFLSRGFGLTDENEIVYTAAALDETEQKSSPDLHLRSAPTGWN